MTHPYKIIQSPDDSKEQKLGVQRKHFDDARKPRKVTSVVCQQFGDTVNQHSSDDIGIVNLFATTRKVLHQLEQFCSYQGIILSNTKTLLESSNMVCKGGRRNRLTKVLGRVSTARYSRKTWRLSQRDTPLASKFKMVLRAVA
jgi:hypothetical protein